MEYRHQHNNRRFDQGVAQQAQVCAKNLSKWEKAVNEIHTWPEYEPQPLWSLSNLAKQLGVSELLVKDESRRFGTELGSFKALGAPYAVYKLLVDEVFRQTGTLPSAADLRSGRYSDITQGVTMCVATDGNQGRGLAYGSKIFGCRCVIYIHAHVSVERAVRIRELGAIVIRIDGEYEASVARAKEDARMNGWNFVSSTSWNDFHDAIPQHVMNAYMVVAEEALDMAPAIEKITHVFVCGGVGSIAASIFLACFNRLQKTQEDICTSLKAPRFVVVEPLEADCLLQSAKNGQATNSQGTLHTMMAGLACRYPSPAAWKILAWLGSDFVAVPDSAAREGMKLLAHPASGDIPVVCGESSAANLGVVVSAGRDPALREKLGLDNNSKVLLFVLEGATDSSIYEEIVGKTPQAVFEAQAVFKIN